MKKTIALLSLAALSAAAISASAADDSSQSFRYTVTEDGVYLSGDVQTSENADVFWGFYDNGVLIKLDKHKSDESFDNIKVELPYTPENLEVKSFLWTSDGKMTPLTARADVEKFEAESTSITIDTSLIDQDCTYYETMYTDKKIPVRESENSDIVIDYALSDSFTLRVNGFELYYTSNDEMIKYLAENKFAKAQLTDIDNDGKYDYAETEYYLPALVDSVAVTDDYTRVYFKIYDSNIRSSLIYYPSKASISVIKGGKEISLNELNENDVIDIAYDINTVFLDSSSYKIIVSNSTADAVLSYVSEYGEMLIADDTEYDVHNMFPNMYLDIGAKYRFYMNMFGEIVYATEIEAPKETGVLVGMYTESGKDCAVVSFIDCDGNIVSYECADQDTEDEFYSIATGNYTYYNGETVTKQDVAENITNMVFSYSITENGRIKLKDELHGYGVGSRTYDADTHTLGYPVNDPLTKMLYIGDYLYNDGNVYVIDESDLEDRMNYNAGFYNRNNEDRFRFCMITDNIGVITPKTNISLVISDPEIVSEDGKDCVKVTMYQGGAETSATFEDMTAENLSEGDIIVYTTKLDGSTDDLNIVMDADADYSSFSKNGVIQFSSAIKTLAENNTWQWTTESRSAEAYFGPVYLNENGVLELFAYNSDGVSDVVSDVKSFDINNAYTYVYDFNNESGSRTSSGNIPSISQLPYKKYGDSVLWEDVIADGTAPAFAFVKTFEGDVTEVVLFNPPVGLSLHQGSENTVELKADNIPESLTASHGMYFNRVIPAVSETTGETEYFALSDDVKIYINGIQTEASDAVLNKYIFQNSGGTVTLTDKTENNTFSTVNISYYITAVAESCDGSSINFKACSSGADSLALNSGAKISIGGRADLMSIKENDVVNIAYDVFTAPESSSFYNIMVSDKTVTGTVDSVSNDTITIDGTIYKTEPSMVNTDYITTGSEYTFSLDISGRIVASVGEDLSYKLGIFTGMKQTENGEAVEISFIDQNGISTVMNASSKNDADLFYSLTAGAGAEYSGELVAKSDIVDNIQDMVFSYSCIDGKIIFRAAEKAEGGADLVYKHSLGKLGKYRINDNDTSLIDVTPYTDNENGTAAKISTENLADSSSYCAYMYGKNKYDTYELCIFTQPNTILPETSVAVVMSEPETVDIDGRNYVALTVAKDGQENIQINVEPGIGAENVSEGDIVIYGTRHGGTAIDFNVVLESDSDYYSFFDKSVNGFSSMIKTIDKNNIWNWSSDDTECKAYFGPVYQYSNKTLELFTEQENGISDTYNDTKAFYLYTPNTYIYDYTSNNRYRVTAGSLPTISKNIYFNDVFIDDENWQLSWDLVKEYECNPYFAFVKTTDGEVTDVVMFLAP